MIQKNVMNIGARRMERLIRVGFKRKLIGNNLKLLPDGNCTWTLWIFGTLTELVNIIWFEASLNPRSAIYKASRDVIIARRLRFR